MIYREVQRGTIAQKRKSASATPKCDAQVRRPRSTLKCKNVQHAGAKRKCRRIVGSNPPPSATNKNSRISKKKNKRDREGQKIQSSQSCSRRPLQPPPPHSPCRMKSTPVIENLGPRVISLPLRAQPPPLTQQSITALSGQDVPAIS